MSWFLFQLSIFIKFIVLTIIRRGCAMFGVQIVMPLDMVDLYICFNSQDELFLLDMTFYHHLVVVVCAMFGVSNANYTRSHNFSIRHVEAYSLLWTLLCIICFCAAYSFPSKHILIYFLNQNNIRHSLSSSNI